ncbi:MAG: flagellar basal body rod protein FlgC [Actinomycetota bacterium]|nr:flagellar basal body rod protein FlgC [Actinomycetota bacterium]MDA8209439.1 flagellar basal body rod protein FlgC [Actinomycetota bacterium]
MSLFPAISVAGTGLNADQTWLDAIASNVANANDTVSPNQQVYQPQEIVVAAQQPSTPLSGAPNSTGAALGSGVAVTGVTTYSANGQLTYDPTNPLANAQGNVRQTGVNLGHELATMVEAQTSYQANVSVINHAKTAYMAAMQIGA